MESCVAFSVSTLSTYLLGDLLDVALGDVDLEKFFMFFFAFPVVLSGATPPSPDTCDVDGMMITAAASAELAPVFEQPQSGYG